MKVALSIALLSLGGSVSATLGIVSSSKCWRKCARQVGVQCDWTDIQCNCRAVNAGLYAAANQCFCNMCSDDGPRIATDWTSLQLNTFSIACSIAFEPIDRQAIDKAVSAASCPAMPANGNYNSASSSGHRSPSNDMPVVMPFVAAPLPPSPREEEAPPASPAVVVLASSPLSSPSMKHAVAAASSSAAAVPLVFDSLVRTSPTSWVGANTIVVPIASTASRAVTYSYATLTVPVSPVPVSTATATATVLTGTSKSGTTTTTKTTGTAAKATGTKTASQSGLAARKEVGSIDLGVSAFALAAAAIFGLA